MAKSDKRNNSGLPDKDTDALTTPGAKTPGGGNVNPFSQGPKETTGGSGGVNPSGPTTGTEGWGLGANEEGKTSERSPTQRTFRCADAGNADCRWESSAQTEDDLMGQIERHGRDAHGITHFDESARRKILDAVRERRAA